MPSSRLPPDVFFTTVEQSSVAISITDAHANILYANPAFCQITGYGADEVIGRNESILSFKTTPRQVYDEMWQKLRERTPWTGRLINRRKDGSRYLAELTISPVQGRDGDTAFFLGMHRDVTAEHRLSREVQNQMALIEAVVDSAPVSLALLDEQRRVVLDNIEYKKLAGGFAAPEPALYLLDAVQAQMGAEFDDARRSGSGFVGREIGIPDARGEITRWFSCSGSWFQEEDGSADAFFAPNPRAYLLLVMHEITDRKRQQEAERMNALRALLAEGERVQQLREAMAGAIFQLQGPMNLITAAATLLGRRGAQVDVSALDGVLRQAVEAGNRALSMLREAMPEEIVEAEAPQNINLLLREVLGLLTEPMLAAGVTVDWQPGADLPPVRGRPTQLRNLFKQIIQNALDAMQETRDAHRVLSVTSARADGRVRVSIGDTGAGIPEALRTRVFEPFFTTRRGRGRHAGMGLALAQDVAMRHGASIEIDPAPAPGCRIHIGFPIPSLEQAA